MIYVLDRLLGFVLMYMVVGAGIALFMILTDISNTQRRMTETRSNFKRFLLIMITWAFRWERSRR